MISARALVLLGALIASTVLCSCASTVAVIDDEARPVPKLVLVPVKFKVITQDDVPYYALTSREYMNLSINMLRIQEYITTLRLWDKDSPKAESEAKPEAKAK